MKLNRVMAGILASLVMASGAFAADETYAIKIGRVHKAGMTFDTHMTGSAENSQVVKKDGKELDSKTMKSTIDLKGRQKISDVNEKGKDRIIVIKIEKCTDAAGKELVAAGSQLTVEFSTKEVKFSLDKGELSEDAEAALQVIFTPEPENKPDDDVIFGTKEKKKAGDSWNVDMKTLMDGIGMKADEKNAKGTVTLKAVEKSQGTECLRIAANVSLKDVVIPNLPKTVTTKSAVLNITLEGLMPRDESLPELETAHTMDFKQVAVDEESKQEVTVTMKATKTEVNTLVK